MKKVLLAFAIIGFAACNNEAETTTPTDTVTVPVLADTTAPVLADTTAPAAVDTIKK